MGEGNTLGQSGRQIRFTTSSGCGQSTTDDDNLGVVEGGATLGIGIGNGWGAELNSGIDDRVLGVLSATHHWLGLDDCHHHRCW
jgi:hypothetical protein